jgi:hypothetical protein
VPQNCCQAAAGGDKREEVLAVCQRSGLPPDSDDAAAGAQGLEEVDKSKAHIDPRCPIVI